MIKKNGDKNVEQLRNKKKYHNIKWFRISLFLGITLLAAIISIELFESEGVSKKDILTIFLTLIGLYLANVYWKENIYVNSIDKYYDRLDSASKRLERLGGLKDEELHVILELDKLEYVLMKYQFGYITPHITYRAFFTFMQLCRGVNEFSRRATTYAIQGAYLRITSDVVNKICREYSESPDVSL